MSDVEFTVHPDRSSAPHPVVGAGCIGFFIWAYASGSLEHGDYLVLRPLYATGTWWVLPLTILIVAFSVLLTYLGAKTRVGGPMVHISGDELEILDDLAVRNWGRQTVKRGNVLSVRVTRHRGRGTGLAVVTNTGTIRCGMTPRGASRTEVAERINQWAKVTRESERSGF